MNKRNVYFVLAVVGLVLPYSQFVPWLVEYGLDPRRFVHDLFANKIGSFFAMDVLVSAIALFSFMDHDKEHGTVRGAWIACVGTITVGVSFGLPTYFFLRELSRRQPKRISGPVE